MTYLFDPAITSGFVSDIAFNHVETLFSSKSRTLSALVDLCEFSQAAVLSEELIVTPAAYEGGSVLSELEFVRPFEPKVTVSERSTSAEPEVGADAVDKSEKTIEIDLDVHGELTSSHPLGELLLCLLQSVRLRDVSFFDALASPGALSGGGRAGEEALERFPTIMLAILAHRGLVEYESEESRRSLEGPVTESVETYTSFASSMNALHQRWGIDPVWSVLEQPMAATCVLDRAIQFAEAEPNAARLKELLGERAAEVPGRAEFFEHWQVPALGLIALSDARDLDDVPRALCAARRRFARLREAVASIRIERAALANRADLTSAAGELAIRELAKFDRELRETYEAFDRELEARRGFRRTELVFSMLDFTLQLIGGLGISMIGTLADAFALKRRAVLQRIPGLFRAASFIRARDDVLAAEVIESLLGCPPAKLDGQRLVLARGFEDGQRYAESHRSRPPEPVVTWLRGPAGDLEITDRQFWQFSCTLDGFLPAMLYGSTPGASEA